VQEGCPKGCPPLRMRADVRMMSRGRPIRCRDTVIGTMMPGTQQFRNRMPITLSDELYEWLREAAFRRRISMAELVRETLTAYRERAEPQLALRIHEDK